MNKKKKENKILKYIKEHKILISVLSLILVLIITSTTLAIFLTSGEGTDKTYTLGNVDVKYTDGNTFKVENSIPLADYEIEEYAAKKEFSFENIGNITMYAEILLTDIEISDNLKNNDFRWELYEKDNNGEYNEIAKGSFANIKESNKISLQKSISVLVGDTLKEYRILVYIRDNGENQNEMMKSHMSCKVTVTATDKPTEYVDNTGANQPELADGMIPVTYDEDKDVWVKADLYSKWYDYGEQMWANAVTVGTDASNCGSNCVDEAEKHDRKYYLNAPSGTPISMDDINSMWVWIPRYKYRIPSDMGSEIGVLNPPEIEVVFETGLSSTGVSEAEYRNAIKDDGTIDKGIYYTHPAFRNGEKIYNSEPYDIGGWDHELTGIWVGKFETSTNVETCNETPNVDNCIDSNPIIKPDVTSLRNLIIMDQFKTSLKFSGGSFDLNTGKVTYVGNEYYGLNKNANAHMIKNTEWGMVAYLSQSRYGKMGNNNYEDRNKEVYINNSSSFYTGRSSGNIPVGSNSSSGTYSYSGIICEDALCLNGQKTDDSKKAAYGASTSGTIYGIYDMSGGSWEYVMGTFINTPIDSQYCDKYTTNILGDATWETMKWYNQYYMFQTWVGRSSSYNYTNSAGLFYVDFEMIPDKLNGFSTIRSSRSVLVP